MYLLLKKVWSYIACLLAGLINGILGAGGGMILVPTLSSIGFDVKKSHAASVCIILPMCIFSAILYLISGKVTISMAFPYLIWGVLGSFIGTYILCKIKPTWLKKIFSLFVIWAAYRLLSA